MFEALSALEIWLLLAGAAAIGFYAGRKSAGATVDAQTRKEMARQAAVLDFSRLPTPARAEVDRLIAAGRTIDAVKLIRETLNTGLYEAKQVVDHRKRAAAQTKAG